MTKRQVPQLRSVREIVKNFNRMICDNSFQRDFVWNLDNQREYISTVIAGGASSAIMSHGFRTPWLTIWCTAIKRSA